MLITCSNCQSKIRVPDSAAGRKGKCPKCGNAILIPAEAAADGAPEAKSGAEKPVEARSPGDATERAEEPVAGAPEPPAAERTADVSEGPPPSRRASRQTDDAIASDTPRKSKARAAGDEEDVDGREDDAEVEGPSKRIKKPVEAKGLSLTSMIVGISGLVITLASAGAGSAGACFTVACPCGLLGVIGAYVGVGLGAILAVVGLSCGFLGLKKGGRGFAMTGLITSGIALLIILAYVVITIIGVVFFGLAVAAGGNIQPGPGPRPFPR